MEEAAKVCFEEIQRQGKRPLFVAVTGDSGSGKSYLVKLIESCFESTGVAYTAVDHDDFLIAREDREPMKKTYYTEGTFAGRSHWEVLENMFRLEEYERVIESLRAGKEVSIFPYSRATGKVETVQKVIKPNDFVIFDTSMMLDKMDFVILVDVMQENIIKRKLIRDSDVRTPEQIIDMHKRVQGYYWEDRGKPSDPDVIIDNNDFSHVLVTVYRKKSEAQIS